MPYPTPSDTDITNLAHLITTKFAFKQAIGVPRGGLRLAAALQPYANPNANAILIVDDVLTTGKSMLEYKNKFPNDIVQGVVIFARNSPPDWIKTLFPFNNF